jgi:CheY-like chemotaxis protein
MSVIVLGQRATVSRAVQDAVERTSEKAVTISSLGSLIEAIGALRPRCVLADAQIDLREATRILRARAETCGTPLIALVEQASDRALVPFLALGVDDVVRIHDGPGITRRVAALSSFDPAARTEVFQGRCLLAHEDPVRRSVLGRLLRQAGFDVHFAGNAQDLCRGDTDLSCKLVVVSDRMLPSGQMSDCPLLAHAIARGTPVVALVSAPNPAELRGVQLVREDAPADDLLFVINELLRPRALIDGRASRRLLFATACAFRPASEVDARIGLTYNLSREGLYVRTFDAPPRGTEVWLELRLPHSVRLCHLRADVIWARSLATGALGAAPPGFGVRLRPEDCPPLDHVAYLAHYAALLAQSSEPGRLV